MSFKSKYSKKSIFSINTEDYIYKKLTELSFNKIYRVDGLFINTKAKYPHPVAINTDFKYLIDLPSYSNVTVEKILSDDEAIQAILNGKVGIHPETYKDGDVERVGFDWDDINE